MSRGCHTKLVYKALLAGYEQRHIRASGIKYQCCTLCIYIYIYIFDTTPSQQTREKISQPKNGGKGSWGEGRSDVQSCDVQQMNTNDVMIITHPTFLHNLLTFQTKHSLSRSHTFSLSATQALYILHLLNTHTYTHIHAKFSIREEA